MEQANGVETPIAQGSEGQESVGGLMSPENARRYRRAVARLNYMAQDRCDLAVASKLLSQSMAQPCDGAECHGEGS